LITHIITFISTERASERSRTFGMGPSRGNYLRYSPRHGPDGAQYHRARKAPPFVRLFKSIGGAAKSDLRCLTTRCKNDNEMMMMISTICSVAHQSYIADVFITARKNILMFFGRRRTNVGKNSVIQLQV
jgi:hypothetical protein